jgi:cation-transporting ATPase 13A2
LRDAQVRFVMVTGDHLRTAVAVARDPACGLVEAKSSVFLSQLTYTSNGPTLQWINDEDDTITLDPNTLRIVGNNHNIQQYELAISGDVYQYLSSLPESQSPDSMFNRCALATQVCIVHSFAFLCRGSHVCILLQIFARMRPSQKASLMTHLQSLGIYIGMCGDCANDCGALKAAHIGVSLSSLEASVSAPFTCSKPNIACVPDVLRYAYHLPTVVRHSVLSLCDQCTGAVLYE